MVELQKAVAGLGAGVGDDLASWVGQAEVLGYYLQVENEVTQIFVVTPRRLLLWEQTADGGRRQVTTTATGRIRRVVLTTAQELTGEMLVEVESEGERLDAEMRTEGTSEPRVTDDGREFSVETTNSLIRGRSRGAIYLLSADEGHLGTLREFARAVARQL